MRDGVRAFGVDPETTREITKETMIRAACELIARIPFADEEERFGALADLADSVLPADVTLELHWEDDHGGVRRSKKNRRS